MWRVYNRMHWLSHFCMFIQSPLFARIESKRCHASVPCNSLVRCDVSNHQDKCCPLLTLCGWCTQSPLLTCAKWKWACDKLCSSLNDVYSDRTVCSSAKTNTLFLVELINNTHRNVAQCWPLLQPVLSESQC